MTIIGRERYACSSRKEQGTCSNGTSIKAQDLEQRVFDGLQSILLGREDTVQAFADAFHDEIKRRQTNNASNKSAVQKDLLKVETGIKRCVDLLLHSDTLWKAYAAHLKSSRHKSALLSERAPYKPKKTRLYFTQILVLSTRVRLAI